MTTEQAYNRWAAQYDSNENQTRDLEAKALKEILDPINFDTCLEIGCGTGKNTVWLVEKVKEMVSVDLSSEMLAKAKEKTTSQKIYFVNADITKDWTFTDRTYDLVTFSLVLEHIEDIDLIFQKTIPVLKSGGHVYIGELHPFKQYEGSKARFDTPEGVQVVPCFNHHISDFIDSAIKYRLKLVSLKEYFDEDNRQGIPRLLTLVFQKD